MTDNPVVLAVAGDRHFAMPLTVSLSSALHHLDRSRQVLVYVLDDGMRPDQKQRCLRSAAAAHPHVTVHWLSADMRDFEGLQESAHITRATYLRLLIPRIVPEDLERVLYIDSDVVVQRDLAELWSVPLGDRALYAVTDYGRAKVGRTLRRVIDRIGIPADAPYFNAGVLLINPARWREQRISERALDFLRLYGDKVPFADQDGLNAVCVGAWGALDPIWNVQIISLDEFARRAENRGNPRLQRQLLKEAGIIHYTGQRKPWHWRYRNHARGAFYRAFAQSGWTDPLQSRVFLATRMLSHCLYRGLSSTKHSYLWLASLLMGEGGEAPHERRA